MNLIEALKKADGKPVARKEWRERGSKETVTHSYNCTFKWPNGNENQLCSENFLADDWYVVEPKSPIEQAIEWELNGDIDSDDWRISMRRIVNLTLDEAKKAAVGSLNGGYVPSTTITLAIDALKVKL